MKHQRLSEEQLYTMNYIHSSHRQIPVHSRDVAKMKLPIVAAITPFPRNTTPPPILSYPFQNAPICKQCGAIASNRYIKCPDSVHWLCQCCSNKNAFTAKFQPIENSFQSQVSVVDAFLPKDPNEPFKILPPCYKPDFFFLIIERTDATMNNGLFKTILDKLRETLLTKSGRLAIFYYDTYLHIPMISKERGFFHVSTIFDLEGALLPPAESCFFQIEKDGEILNKYLDYLENAPVLPPMMKLFDLVKAINAFSSRARIPTVFLTSQVEIGTSTQYREFALSQMKNAVPLKFLCLTPFMAPPDFSPLSELSLLLNSKVQVFSQSQLNYLPTDLLNALIEPTFIDPLIYVILHPSLKIIDVKGNGIRRTEQSFSTAYLSPNDTIYVFLGYKNATMDQPSPSIQFQVRYHDSRRRRYIRTISYSYTLVDNMGTVTQLYDFDVYIASVFIRCIDKAKEFGSPQAALDQFKIIREEFVDDKFARLFYFSLEPLTRSKIENAFGVAPYFLTQINFPLIMGRGPIDISLFFAPEAYMFDSHSTQMQGPITLSGVKIASGALYIRLNNGRGLILLGEKENVQQWVEAIGVPPINELINSVCKERVIEIVAPSISSEHNLYKHVMMCINTPLYKKESE